MGTTLLLFWMASAAAKLVQLINFNHDHTIFSFQLGQLHSLPQKEVLFRNLQEQGAISQQEGVVDLHGKGGDATFLEQCARGLSCNGLRFKVALS